MKYGIAAVLMALVLFTAARAPAEQTCALLSPSELAAATGGTVGQGHQTDTVISSGPSKGETLQGCMWSVGEVGMVTISLMRAAKGPEREAGLAKLREGLGRLEAKGWKRESKSYGGVKCSLLTPPSGEERSPIMTGCLGEARGMGISVGHMTGPSRKPVGMDEVHTLFEKAVGRLP